MIFPHVKSTTGYELHKVGHGKTDDVFDLRDSFQHNDRRILIASGSRGVSQDCPYVY